MPSSGTCLTSLRRFTSPYAKAAASVAEFRVLDLFAGLRTFSAAFQHRNWLVTTLDWDDRFDVEHHIDILKIRSLEQLDGRGRFDMVLASPPCECFSVASIGTHWTGGHRAYQPRTEAALHALRIMSHTFDLITDYGPRFWVVENPQGVMKKLAPIEPFTTTWYCHWGDSRAKPTNLWGRPPRGIPWRKKVCHNGCDDHEKAPRGARTGTQGIRGAAERSVIPYRLSRALCLAAEHAMKG